MLDPGSARRLRSRTVDVDHPRQQAVVDLTIVGWLVAAVVAIGARRPGGPERVGRSGTASSRQRRRASRASTIRDLYDIVFGIAVVIFFVVEGLIIWTVIRYRRKPGDDELPPQTHGNNLAEIIWTLVPTVIVIFLFVISWQTLNTVDADVATAGPQGPGGRRPVPVVVRVPRPRTPRPTRRRSFTITAPEGPDGGLTLPAGQTTHLYLHSPDVIHAFYVPQFLFKRDVVPGQLNNQFDLDDPGQRRRPDVPRPVRRAVRRRPPDRCCSTSTPLAPADFDAWLQKQIAGRQRDPAAGAERPRPPGRRSPLVAQERRSSTSRR